ncbi:tetrahydrofolate synthase, partial [Coemansia aciculifera]
MSTCVCLDGKAVADAVRGELAQQVAQLKAEHPSFQPKLIALQVGGRSDSSAYIRQKAKACKEIGIDFEHVQLDETVEQAELDARVEAINDDPTVHGLLVQLPLPAHLSTQHVVQSISVSKDVDGFHAENIGQLSKRAGAPQFQPCTPLGCIELLQRYGVAIGGKRVVVVGRSDIVGAPLAAMLTRLDATVTLCHSRTAGIEALVRDADILVVAIGQPGFVRADWIKPGACVVDVGMNAVDDATKKAGFRWVGDVEACAHAGHMTPVPGGVGPMTVAMLLRNVVSSAQRHAEGAQIVPSVLRLATPVPSDIAIAQAAVLKPVAQLGAELRLARHELQPHGRYTAKVGLGVLERLGAARGGRYVVVTGISPTPLGEGKSTVTVGLAQALYAHAGRTSFACVRQPSQGPTFGIKGGAAGGGYAQVAPMTEMNLHLTGDIHAISAATNLVAAAVDARRFHEATQTDAQLLARL